MFSNMTISQVLPSADNDYLTTSLTIANPSDGNKYYCQFSIAVNPTAGTASPTLLKSTVTTLQIISMFDILKFK